MRLILPRAVSLTEFTCENVTRTGASGNCRRWEAYPWQSAFETWNNEREGYLERINDTRFAAYTKTTANLDIAFATSYDRWRHSAYAWVDGTHYGKSAEKANWGWTFSGQMAFFGNMNTGTRAYALRLYNRVLTTEERLLNNVIDQIRLLGRTPETAALPAGWAFGADGVLRSASGKVLLRPEGTAEARAITGVAFSTVGEQTLCTVTLAAREGAETNALYLAWGAEDAGTSPSDWPAFRRLARVAPDAESVSFALPSECLSYAPDVVVRVFAATASRPYDYRLTAVGASGTQWVDTGYYANARTIARFRAKFTDFTPQQRVFGADADTLDENMFSFSGYINGASYWAFTANDGTGSWQSTARTAKEEETRLEVSAPDGRLRHFSAAYGLCSKTNGASRTLTATTEQALFASARKQCAYHVRPMLGGVIYEGSYEEEGVLLHHYLPCVADGRAAFFDAVENRLLFSSTATDLLASGENCSTAWDEGETPTQVSEAFAVPHGVYQIDTGSTPTTIDYRLFYSESGSKRGAAPLTLTNPENSFGGRFTVCEGLLAANFGAGLATTDHLVLDGGAWCPGGTAFVPAIGAGAGEVELIGEKAGFTTYGADASLTVGGGSFAYPAANLTTKALILNDAFATNTLTLTQPLAVADGSDITLEVGGGSAVLAKGATARGTFTKRGAGEARFEADNTFGSLVLTEGATSFVAPEGDTAAFVATNDVTLQTGAKASLLRQIATVAGNIDAKAPSSATLTATDLTTPKGIRVAYEGSGNAWSRVLIDGCAIKADNLQVGNYSAGWNQNGEVTLTNNTTIEVKQLTLRIGNVFQRDGSVKVTGGWSGDTEIGLCSWQTAAYYLSGGTFERTSRAGNFQIGRMWAGSKDDNCFGWFFVEGTGVLITHCEWPSIGRLRYNTATLTVRNGGRYEADYTSNAGAGLCVGDEGSGTVEVSTGGTIDLTGYVSVVNSYADHTERQGTVRVLDGGTLICRGIRRGTETVKAAIVVLDGGLVKIKEGGTLQNPFLVNMTSAQLGTGGTTFDTNGRDALFRQNLTARDGQTWTAPATAEAAATCAAFTKKGAGTLTLEGSNTYAVATCVAEGTLATATANALPTNGLLRLAGGSVALKGTAQCVAQLTGSGSISDGTLAVSGTVWPGLAGEGGTLTLTSAAFSAPRLAFTIAPGGICGKLVSTGLIDLGGVEIAIANAENKGKKRIVLVEAATLTGTPTVTGLPEGYRVVKDGNRLRLSAPSGLAVLIR